MSDLVAYTQRTLLVSLSQGPASDADAFCNPRLTRKPSTLTRRNTPDTDRTVGAMREPTGSPKTDPAVAPTIGIPRHGPDSVHSWITAGACALATFFGVGGRRSAGFLYIAILDTFKATRSQAAWPVILMGGVLLLAGRCAVGSTIRSTDFQQLASLRHFYLP